MSGKKGNSKEQSNYKGYKILLWKAYFDKGWSLTNYFKYPLIAFGWATDNVQATLIIGLIWAFSCLILGRVWFKYRMIDTENEINNIFNPFQREVRKKLNSIKH
tara:strand:+ start:8373 stop:8684 length:312 start_codon:yes stop_codon:yes gene_type:complete